MDEKAAVRAVARAIDDNVDTFLQGIFQNGEQRVMEAAHRTVLGSIAAYYTCKVHVRRKRGGFMEGVSNLSHGTAPRISQYDIEIFVADYALLENEEEDSFVTAHENFRLAVDRMADYFLKDAESFADIESEKSFKLPTQQREVTVENLNPEESEDGFPVLGSVIRFVIIGCND